jgi:hypothetical protein
MFLELLIPLPDLRAFLAGVIPLTIHLDATGGSHSLALSSIDEVTLVPDVGARLVCKARLHWPVLGIDAPITLTSLRVLLIPEVIASPTGERLRFRITLEHVDISGVPGAFDDKISRSINEKLAEHHAELSWDFSKTFANVVPLPHVLDELEALDLRAAWGKMRITEEGLVFALSLHAECVRRGDEPRAPAPRASEPAPVPRADTGDGGAVHTDQAPPSGHISVAAAAVFGLAAGAAFFGLRSLVSRR